MSKNPEYRDPERCRICGGKCCSVYFDNIEGINKPADANFEERLRSWNKILEESGASKIPPLFDPWIVNLEENEHIREELFKKGINPYKCNYCGSDGCILPWEIRPYACRGYRCQKWYEDSIS